MEFVTPVLNAENNPYDDSKLLMEQMLSADDGRPIIAQAWAESGYTFLTYFFCNRGLETASKEDIYEYLVAQGFKLNRDRRHTARGFTDQVGNHCWNFTITIGEPDCPRGNI